MSEQENGFEALELDEMNRKVENDAEFFTAFKSLEGISLEAKALEAAAAEDGE